MRRVTVVGAGVFGTWIAHALKGCGWRVTVIDQHGPASSRASSGGETRIIRAGYGALSVYARWARASLADWLALEDRVGQRLFVRTGALFLSRASTWLNDTASTLAADGVPTEWIPNDQLPERFPHVRFGHPGQALFERDAGVLFARRAVHALAGTLTDDGVRFIRARIDPEDLIRQSGDDALIFAAGAWLPALFPEAVGDVIVPTRQEVFFFGPPAGDQHCGPADLPAWVAFDDGIYGLPDLEHRGVKVAFDAHGVRADPESMDRTVDAAAVTRMREALRRHLPDLVDAPLLETRVCLYENTTDGHFLIDRLPGHERVWITGGGSGHGFKHGPAIGRYVADLIERGADPEPMFRLSGRPPRARAVY